MGIQGAERERQWKVNRKLSWLLINGVPVLFFEFNQRFGLIILSLKISL